MEAYDASVFGPKILAENGVKVALKSDHPVIYARDLMYEAAKANHYGLSTKDSIAAVTSVPAQAMGQSHRYVLRTAV
jgi:imidazolonepropionase-like amidohydrolase